MFNHFSGGIHDLVSSGGMSSSSHPWATAAGVQMLLRGGNAADAALATAFALVVCEPAMSHLGGQGNALVHMRAEGRTVALDYYPTAPAGSRPDMYEWLPGPTQGAYRFWTRGDANTTGALSVAVPGSVAGWLYVHRRWCSLPLDVLLEPSIQYARRGVPLTPRMASFTAENRDRLAQFPAAAAIFLRPDGSPREAGDLVVQEDLARALELIARGGEEVFYRGEIASAIIEVVRSAGGILTAEDLADYPARRFRVLDPEQVDYREYQVQASPLTSSGVLLPILNLLEGFRLSDYEPQSGEKLHLLCEAMKLAFADRLQYIGDPEFVNVPIKGLLAKTYAAERRALIRFDRANRVADLAETGSAGRYFSSGGVGPGNPWTHQEEAPDPGKFSPGGSSGEGPLFLAPDQSHTTHHSHVDRWGNFVSLTQSLGDGFGSAMVVPGYGFFLNNAMKLFDPRPGRSNSVAPHKHPATAPCPTLVLRAGRPVMALGSPSGTRIINAIVQTIVNVVDQGLGLQHAVNLPRIHWSGDEFEVEQDVPPPAQDYLRALGHELQLRNARSPWFGSIQVVARDPETGLCHGAADPRRQGAVAG
ncbi:MAG: gamma-glutamyltransferase, partial [Actinobacteria bacterium]|nr:gamma-glutamyltransferase [Actinomycetota bacterium]